MKIEHWTSNVESGRGGFDRPILHGLCTYGFATRAIVNEPLAGDVARLREFSACLSDSVYPGDTLTTEGRKSGGGYIFQTRTDGSIVLSNARAVIEWAYRVQRIFISHRLTQTNTDIFIHSCCSPLVWCLGYRIDSGHINAAGCC